MQEFGKSSSHAKILREVNAPVEITDIIVSQLSGQGEFPQPLTDGNTNIYHNLDTVKRIGDHIEYLAKIANTEHEKMNFDSGTKKMNDGSKNKVTRLNLHEFSLYPKDRPLTAEEYQTLLIRISEIAKNCHENLHLMLGSVPVQGPDNQVYNMVIYAQCGENAKLNTFAKSIPHQEDPLYPNTLNPSFLGVGSYSPLTKVWLSIEPKYKELCNECLSDKSEKSFSALQHALELSLKVLDMEIDPDLGSSEDSNNDSDLELLEEIKKNVQQLMDDLDNSRKLDGEPYREALIKLSDKVDKLCRDMKTYSDNVFEGRTSDFEDKVKMPQDEFENGKITHDDFGKIKIAITDKNMEEMATEAAQKIAELKKFIEERKKRTDSYRNSLVKGIAEQNLLNLGDIEKWLTEQMDAFNEKEQMAQQKIYREAEGFLTEIELSLLPNETTLKKTIDELKQKMLLMPNELSESELNAFKEDVEQYQKKDFIKTVVGSLTQLSTEWQTEHEKEKFIGNSERVIKILTLMMNELPSDEQFIFNELVSKLQKNEQIERNEIENFDVAIQQYANRFENLRHRVYPLGHSVNISHNSSITCVTAGGAEFITAIDICLDHNYAIARENLISLQRRETSTPLPTHVSHILTSSGMKVNKKKTFTDTVTHSGSHLDKPGVYKDQFDTSEDPQELSSEAKVTKPNDDITYSNTKVNVSNNEIIIENPPFGPNCVIRKYPSHELSPLPLNRDKDKVKRSSPDTYTANYYVRKMEAILHSTALPAKSARQQKCIKKFKKELMKLRNDPDITVQKFYSVLNVFSENVSKVNVGVKEEEKEDTISLTRQILHMEHYLDTKALSLQSYIISRVLSPTFSKLFSADNIQLVVNLENELKKTIVFPPQVDNDGKLILPVEKIAQAIFDYNVAVLKIGSTEDREQLTKTIRKIEKYLIKQYPEIDQALNKLYEGCDLENKEKLVRDYYQVHLDVNQKQQSKLTKKIEILENSREFVNKHTLGSTLTHIQRIEQSRLNQFLREGIKKDIKDARREIITAKTRIEEIDTELQNNKNTNSDETNSLLQKERKQFEEDIVKQNKIIETSIAKLEEFQVLDMELSRDQPQPLRPTSLEETREQLKSLKSEEQMIESKRNKFS